MILINSWIYLLATFHNTFSKQGTHAWKRNNQAHALKWQAVAYKKKGCLFILPPSLLPTNSPPPMPSEKSISIQIQTNLTLSGNSVSTPQDEVCLPVNLLKIHFRCIRGLWGNNTLSISSWFKQKMWSSKKSSLALSGSGQYYLWDLQISWSLSMSAGIVYVSRKESVVSLALSELQVVASPLREHSVSGWTSSSPVLWFLNLICFPKIWL